MSFKKFLNIFKGEEENEETLIDPIIEQRRKEKFSAPLIYNDEPVKKDVEKNNKRNTNANIKVNRVEKRSVYTMTEIISPMTGKKNEDKSNVVEKKKVVKTKKVVRNKDQLVPIISPIYGSTYQEEELDIVEEANSNKVQQPGSVTENLRNIAKIIEEDSENQLRIIEARTGEFQLDFSNLDSDNKTLIDEIDEEMSLDELMNLYEKKKE